MNPKDFLSIDDLISTLKEKYRINLVIISSNPSTHFEYGMSCIKHDLNVVCDKPIVSRPNAATDITAASDIWNVFKKMLVSYSAAKKRNPSLLFHSILRRRSLEPFVHIANELELVYKKTGAGINNMTILVNGGIYKLPAELSAPGAHGYLDGIGSLAHSAYHYIDVLAWYISRAPGKAVKMIPRLNYILRIKDYLNTRAYQPVANTIKARKKALLKPILSKEVLGCELNSGFTFLLQNEKDITVGEATFLYNHLSFTPRINNYDRNKLEPANFQGGGRTSYFFLNVNQDGLQSWQISKHDTVFEGNSIILQGKRNPLISGGDFGPKLYKNVYEPEEISMKNLLAYTLDHVIRNRPIIKHPIIRELGEESLATEIYASCYRLIANDFNRLSMYKAPQIRINK